MLSRILRNLAIVVLTAFILFPLLYGFSASFFTNIDFTDTYAHLLPSDPTLSNYQTALSNRYYPRFILNSLITAFSTAAVRMVITVMAAFAFTHLEFRFRRSIFIMLLATLFIPSDAMLYPNYKMIADLRLLDTYAAIILPSVFSASALVMLFGSYASISHEFYDAARIDGARDSLFVMRILVPMTQSIIAILFLQAFITSFNSYLWPLLVTNRNSMRTVQVGITMLGFAQGGEYGAQFASIIIIVVPFLILLAFGRKHITKYLIAGIYN